MWIAQKIWLLRTVFSAMLTELIQRAYQAEKLCAFGDRTNCWNYRISQLAVFWTEEGTRLKSLTSLLAGKGSTGLLLGWKYR